MTEGISDGLMLTIAKAVPGDSPKLPVLASELGINPAQAQDFINTNRIGRTIKTDGNLDMLMQWRNGVRRADQGIKLKAAFINAGLAEIADLHLKKFQVPKKMLKKKNQPGSMTEGVDETILINIAKAVQGKSNVQILGKELGFKLYEVQPYIETNELGGKITTSGTLNMLRAWKENTTRADQGPKLKAALIRTGFEEIAEDYLGHFRVPKKLLKKESDGSGTSGEGAGTSKPASNARGKTRTSTSSSGNLKRNAETPSSSGQAQKKPKTSGKATATQIPKQNQPREKTNKNRMADHREVLSDKILLNISENINPSKITPQAFSTILGLGHVAGSGAQQMGFLQMSSQGPYHELLQSYAESNGRRKTPAKELHGILRDNNLTSAAGILEEEFERLNIAIVAEVPPLPKVPSPPPSPSSDSREPPPYIS